MDTQDDTQSDVYHDIYLDSEALDALHDQRIAQLPAEQRVTALRFGLAVTYDDMYGWRTWTQSLASLLWTHLTMPDARAVGWDVLSYDLIIIRNSAQASAAVRAMDLSAQIAASTGRRYKLDTIARANLGRGRSADTQTVIGWLRAGDASSMARASEHCRANVQLVIDLMDLLRRGQPLVLPGRLEPDERGWAKTREATLRVHFTPEGEWLRCEDLRGNVIKARDA